MTIAINQPLITAVDALIACRDVGADVQDAIDLLMEQIEKNAEADAGFQASQAADKWATACHNNVLWN